MKYAVCTVSTPTMTPEEIAPKLKEIGYDGVEWRIVDEAPNPPGMTFWHGNKATIPFTGILEKAPEVRKLAEDNGLAMPSLGTYVEASDLASVETAMKAASTMGVPQLRVNVARYDGSEPFTPIWDQSRDAYRQVAKLAGKYGVRALIELHHGSICPSASAARRFLEGFDPAYVGVIHDAGNMVYEGFENYRMGFELLGDYLAHIHVKNARWLPQRYLEDKSVVWTSSAAPVHKGIADMRVLFRALRQIGYDGWVSLEDFSSERPLEDRLRENLAFLKKIEAEAGTA